MKLRLLITTILTALGVNPSSAQTPGSLDFSTVTSRVQVEKLAQEGKLFKILLFPAEFGGEDMPLNVVYVPAGIPEIKNQTTATLSRLAREGIIDKLTVDPEYKGKSFVPSRIVIRATDTRRKEQFNQTIPVW
jgi:hypothetical protein